VTAASSGADLRVITENEVSDEQLVITTAMSRVVLLAALSSADASIVEMR
jgi:hypothetical protein